MSTQEGDVVSPISQSEDVPVLQARIVELETQVTSLQAQLAEYKSFVDDKDTEIASLRAQIAALQNEQDELQEKVLQAQENVKLAKEQVKAATAASEEAAAAVAAVNADNANNHQNIKNEEKQAQEQDEIDELKEELEILREQVRRQEQLLLQQASAPIPASTEYGAIAATTLISSGATSITNVGTNKNKKPGQVTLKMRKNRQDKLAATRAQITAWLNRILSPDPFFTTEDLMERLASGVTICNLAIVVSDTAIPILGRVHLKAQPYSILAHENVLSFLRVCYEWGLKRVECFSAQDLLNTNKANRNERLVVETLLSLSRVVYIKFGIEPPWMVKAEIAIDESEALAANTDGNGDATAQVQHKEMMDELEHEKLLEALRAYCALHGIVDIPSATERKGQFIFSDGTKSHIRMFEIDPENADGSETRETATIMEAVENGELVLLVRHNNKWEELHKFLREHAAGSHSGNDGDLHKGAITSTSEYPQQKTTETPEKPQYILDKEKEEAEAALAKAQAEAEALAKAQAEAEALAKAREEAEAKSRAEAEALAKARAEAEALAKAKAEAEAEAARARAEAEALAKRLAEEKAKVVDVMADAYEANWEEEDEDDDEDDEEDEAYQRALWEAQQAEAAARAAALQAQKEQEAEFKRTLVAQNKMKQSYLQGADLSGDMGEILNKVRSNMGQGDFDAEKIDPTKANFSAIINTSDYKRFRDVTLNEIQVMTNDDLERLAEYTAKQEFFYLTALAVKMTHELSYSSAFQVLTNQELWRRAIEQNIPFHRFYTFVHNEITKSYLEQSAQERLNQNTTQKDSTNLRSHREVMLANIKERQRQKMNSKFD